MLTRHTMKLRYLSDLHLEFIKPNKLAKFMEKIKPTSENEVLILAGDIGYPTKSYYKEFIKHVSSQFQQTFVIMGNHEYYNKKGYNMEENKNRAKIICDEMTNVKLLDNEYVQYNGYCIIGTTLWSHISDASYPINDVFSIPDMTIKRYNRLNKEAVEFLTKAVEENEKCIITTHHLPSKRFIAPKYLTRQYLPYNQWFYCDMDDFINKYQNKIECWFYGHTHTASLDYLYGIPFCCNPIGYPNENPVVDFNTIIEFSGEPTVPPDTPSLN